MDIATTAIAASAIGIPLAYKFLRSGPVKVNCWFCNQDTTVEASKKNSFTCPHCEQYNGFKNDGDYNKIIPGQLYPAEPQMRYCRSAQIKNKKGNIFPDQLNKLSMSPKNENGLCSDCNHNQEIIMRKVAEFEPINEDRWNEELEEFRYKLDRIYQLCPRCTIAVHGKLEQDKANYSYLLDIKHKLKRAIGSTINQFVNPRIKKSRRFFFAGGGFCETLRLLVVFVSIIMFLANVEYLQRDTGATLIDFSVNMKNNLSMIYEFLIYINVVMLISHFVACLNNKCRTTLTDLLLPIIGVILLVTYLINSKEFMEDISLCRCACSSFISILATASFVLPRKKLHKKRPNRIISSAFSVASTPISQCSSQNSRNNTLLESSPSSFSRKRQSPISNTPSPLSESRQLFTNHLKDISNEKENMNWREKSIIPDKDESAMNLNNTDLMDWDDSESILKSTASFKKPVFKQSIFQQSALRSQREATPSSQLAPSVASMSLFPKNSGQLGAPSTPGGFKPARSLFASPQSHFSARPLSTARSLATPRYEKKFEGTNIPSGSVYTSISQQDRNSMVGGIWQGKVIFILFFLVFIILLFQVAFFYILLKK